MLYLAYIEVQDDGTTMAHVPGLPGCISTGLTQEIAVARLPDAIRDYNDWLRRHGEQVPPPEEPIQVQVGTTQVDAYPGADPDPDGQFALLPPDRQTLSDADVARLLRLMSYTRQDLLQLVTGLTPEVLNWQPTSPQDQAPAWCIEDVLEHMGRTERFLASRMSTNAVEMLQEARQQVVQSMSSLNDKQLNQVIEHQGEYWTASKVFRRLLEHEREHTRHIEQILARLTSSQGLVS